jgi:hypothetical protein
MFDWIVLIGAISGLSMVIGSMILLWKGAISLNVASAREGFTVELAKEIKLSTRYPAIALFIIGLLFFFCAAWFAQRGTLQSMVVTGKITSPDDIKDIAVYLLAGPWVSEADDGTGKIEYEFHPHLKNLKIQIIAPGYKGTGQEKTFRVSGQKISIGEIDVGRRVVKEVKPMANIPPRQPSNTPSEVDGRW